MSWIKDSNGANGTVLAGAAMPNSDISVTTANGGEVVPIPLKSIIFDRGKFFSNDGKVNIEQDGVYIITGQVTYPKNKIGSRWVQIRKNGTEIVARGMSAPNDATDSVTATTSIVLELVTGDYLELTTSQLSGDNFSITARVTQLSIARLGA